MPRHTNQAADDTPGTTCCHGPGEGNADSCCYLRALDALQMAIAQAARAYQHGIPERHTLGELWLLLAEVSTAHDACPSTSHVVHLSAGHH